MTIKDRFNNIFNKNKATVITIEGNNSQDIVRNLDISNIKGNIVFHNKTTSVYDDVHNEEAAEISEKTQELSGNDYRIITISQWRRYMNEATVPTEYCPSWSGMIDLYDNQEEDSHISGIVQTLTERVRSKDFYIVNKDNKKDEEVTKMFHSKWFFDFLEFVVNAKLRGFNLIQLGDFDEEKQRFDKVEEVNQKHVRIDLGGVTRNEYDQQISQDYNEGPFKTWTIPIWYNKLGLLNKAARWYIYKTEVSRFWAEYNETYGVPAIIGKTKLTDNARKKNFIKYLQTFASSRYGLFDVDDIVEGIDMKSSTSAEIYEKFIRLADEQMSKGMLASTMVLDDGSSRSQSEVHETNTELMVESLARWAQFIINDDLIWRMQAIGFNIPDGYTFKWENSEKLSSKENAEVIKLLSDSGFQVSEDDVKDKTGYEVEIKATTGNDDEGIISNLNKKYNDS